MNSSLNLAILFVCHHFDPILRFDPCFIFDKQAPTKMTPSVLASTNLWFLLHLFLSFPAHSFCAVFRYDCKENVWTYISCLGVGRDSACVGVLGNRIYCLGGHDGHKPLSITEEYDPYQDTWTEVSLPSQLLNSIQFKQR